MKVTKNFYEHPNISGIAQLILEIHKAQQTNHFINFSSGNPFVFPEVTNLIQHCLTLVTNEKKLVPFISQYAEFSGHLGFLDELIKIYSPIFGELTHANVVATIGSQSAIYYAAFAFITSQKTSGTILLPQCPDYADYAILRSKACSLISYAPIIEKTGKHSFRYKYDLDQMDLSNIKMVLLSRPTNPSGLILEDSELLKFSQKCEHYNIPVVIDGAYSPPIPGLVYQNGFQHICNKNVINLGSFSKVGFAGSRVGFAIGAEEFISPIKTSQIGICLSVPKEGQFIVTEALKSGILMNLTSTIIQPFYLKQMLLMKQAFSEYCSDDVPYYFHESQGGMFLWLWLENCPLTNEEIWLMVKKERIYLTPGKLFFYGLDNKEYKHQDECFRFNLTETEEHIIEGMKTIAEIINKIYNKPKIKALTA